jgi:hypothetical protein
MELNEICWEGADVLDLTQYSEKVAGCCVNGNEHLSSMKFWEFLDGSRDSDQSGYFVALPLNQI